MAKKIRAAVQLRKINRLENELKRVREFPDEN